MVFTLAEAWLANYEETRLIMQANPIAFTIVVKGVDKQVAQVSAIIKAHLAELAVRAAALGIHPINSNVYEDEDAESSMVFDDAQTPDPVTPEPVTPPPVTRKRYRYPESPDSPDSPESPGNPGQNQEDRLAFVRQRLF
jgi:hypothetical protein